VPTYQTMNKTRNFIFTCILLFLLPHTEIFAGNQLPKNQLDTVLIRRYIEFGDQLKVSHADSGLYYYQKALKLINWKTAQDKQLDYFFALVHLKLANIYMDMYQADSSAFHNSIAFTVATRINTKEIIAKLLVNKGTIYSFKSDYDSAILSYRKALKLSKELTDQKMEAKIYVNIGVANFYRGNTDSAYIYFRKPITIAEKIKDKELLAAAYNNLALLYANNGKLDEALSNFTSSLKIYKEMKASSDIILCESNIASIFFNKCDYAKTLELYNSVVEKCLKVNDQMQLAKSYHNIGEVYYNISAFEEATNYYLKSIEIRGKLKDKQGVSSDYMSIGSVQISNKNPKKALAYYKKALSILMQIHYIPGLTMVYNRIGDVYIELNKPDSVIYYLNKAENLAVKTDDKTILSSVFFSFAQVYKKTADYQKALFYFNKNVGLKEQLGDVETIGIANYNIADIYNTLGKKSSTPSEKRGYFQKAQQYAAKAYQIAEKNQFLEVKANAAKELKNVFEGLGDLKHAIFYYDIYTTATDSLYKKTQSKAAIFAEVHWQAEKKQQQIQLLEKERVLTEELIKSKAKENKDQRTLILLLIGGLVIVLVSISLITYFVRKQRKLEFQQQLNKISMLRLENARSRVSPHFLFNSLSTIQDELSDKPDASKRLHAIVNMLRCSLLNVEKPSIPLHEEIEFVNNYLLLQKAKFISDLQIEINIDNKDLFDYKVPAMIIQIPVENAIKHGLAGKLTGEKILKVDAKRENGSLKISIADNGIGRELALTNNKMKSTGTGLKVISQTLHLLNSKNEKKIQFSLIDQKNERGENCGTKVDISIPVTFNFELLN